MYTRDLLDIQTRQVSVSALLLTDATLATKESFRNFSTLRCKAIANVNLITNLIKVWGELQGCHTTEHGGNGRQGVRQDKMAGIIVKNGYNGFQNSKKQKDNNQPKQSSFSNKLPPLQTHKDDFISNKEASLSPVLQPSVSSYSRTTTDIVILLDDEVRRIHRLGINLGIRHHYEVAEYHNRFHSRSKPGRLPKIERSKCWRQSHNWIKRMENGTGFDLRRSDVALGKKCDTSSVDLDSLPRGRKKVLEAVDIPTLGCSYRLPMLKKHKQKTRR